MIPGATASRCCYVMTDRDISKRFAAVVRAWRLRQHGEAVLAAISKGYVLLVPMTSWLDGVNLP